MERYNGWDLMSKWNFERKEWKALFPYPVRMAEEEWYGEVLGMIRIKENEGWMKHLPRSDDLEGHWRWGVRKSDAFHMMRGQAMLDALEEWIDMIGL